MNGHCGVWASAWTLGISILLGASCVPLRAQQAAPDQTPNSEADSSTPNNVTLRHTMEDWSTITLQGSDLKMLPPNLGPFNNMDKYTRERIQVQWRDLDPIDLYIIKPQGIEKPPVIFYLYSYESASKRAFNDDRWCQRVTSGGFAAVAFVPALTEDRFQMRPMKQWFISELQESLATTTHDVQMILNFLELRRDLDLSHVGIFGSGSGATVGILAAAADPRIKVLDLINPWADWPHWLKTAPMISRAERMDFLKPEFLAKVAPLDPAKWLPKLTSQQIRLQIIDETVNLQKDAISTLENVAPKNVNIIHFTTVAQHKNATATSGGSFQWIKNQIDPPPPLRRQDSAQASLDPRTVKP